MAGHKKKGRGHAEDEHPDERWLLTYADMITLLMALFMVLFSISSVNTAKWESLQRALQNAFAGDVLPGGEAIKQTGAEAQSPMVRATAPRPSLQGALGRPAGGGAKSEQRDLERLKEQIDGHVRAEGLEDKVQTQLDSRGLMIRIVSDDLLFTSGSASLQRAAAPLMTKLARLLRAEGRHPIRVEGHTDDVPIRSGAFPSNWELAGARAAAVVRAFARREVAEARMEVAGRAHLDPVATNATAKGRARNRRVQILVPRTEAGT